MGQEEVYNALSETTPKTITQLHKELGVNKENISRSLRKLVFEGCVIRIGTRYKENYSFLKKKQEEQ